MILTARVPAAEMLPFSALRQFHFPKRRDQPGAHLTILNRIPGDHPEEVLRFLATIATSHVPIEASVTGVRILDRGVAFEISSPALQELRTTLKERLKPDFAPAISKIWRPHITIQNGVDPLEAQTLRAKLASRFRSRRISVTGYNLWHYRKGLWELVEVFEFDTDRHATSDLEDNPGERFPPGLT